MQARMKNPALVIPDAMQAIQQLNKALRKVDVPGETLELVHLRASQINGCSVCVHMGAAGEQGKLSREQLATVVAWRDAPFFSDAERAALALTEAATRLCDRSDAVSDEIWDEAARHYDEEQLSAIILMISMTNLFNRLNATTRQVAGEWG